ncbi:MAG: transcriptional regulator, TetR family [Subtercola sp.]|nr:transcriptional regulator, TetR family [Subtercola sp.]
MSLDVEVAQKPKKNLQEKRSSLSTKLLLQATADLIAERGYEHTTLIEIGKRAGYSHGLVTRRFGSKAALVQSLIVKLSERFGHGALADTVGDNVGADALEAVISEIRGHAVSTDTSSLRGFYALLFESLKPNVDLREFMADLHADFIFDLTAKVEEGRAAGRLADGIDPAEITELTVSALRGLAYRWMLDPERVDFVAGLDSLSKYVDLIAARPGAGARDAITA